MRSIATIVAVLLCAAGGYWALQAALPPTEYPTPGELDDAEQRRPEAPQLQERPDQIEFRWTLQPPREAMAARTAVEMGETWNATLWADVYWPGGDPPVESVSLATLGGTARVYRYLTGTCEINSLGEINYMSPASPAADVQAAVEEWADGAPEGFAAYIIWAVAASAPGDSDYVLVANGWQGDIPPEDPVWAGPTEIEVAASIVVSGLYLKRARTSNPPDDRQLMDFTDQTITDTWWADEETSVTVTCGDVSAQGAMTYSDEEVEIGALFYLGLSIALNEAPLADTVYARIKSIQWGDTPLGLGQVSLWKPGKAGTDPNSDGWCREQDGDGYHVSAGDDIEMSHTKGVATDESWSGAVGAPWIISWNPLDGKTDAQGPEYAVEYTSNAIEWEDDEA